MRRRLPLCKLLASTRTWDLSALRPYPSSGRLETLHDLSNNHIGDQLDVAGDEKYYLKS
jgi:hypothetical protein